LLREWIEHADVVGEVRVVLGDLRGGEEVNGSVVPVNNIEIVHIECECTLAPLEEIRDKILAKLQLMLNLFSAGKFKLKRKNA